MTCKCKALCSAIACIYENSLQQGTIEGMGMGKSETMGDRNQISITLSDVTLEEFKLVAGWKGQPLASFVREVLEQHQLSPGFSSAVRRAKDAMEGANEKGA
jgi:uncharacterized protein YukE